MAGTLWNIVAGGILVLGLAGPLLADPLKDAAAAYDKGDHAAALATYRFLAETGDAEAQFKLAAMYRLGKGVEPDDHAVARWSRSAADQCHAPAQHLLGLLYILGEGVKQSDIEAAAWFRHAADQGLGHAQLRLGRAYYHGEGVPQDFGLAHKWCNLAAAQRTPGAGECRTDAATHLTITKRIEAEELTRAWQPLKRSCKN